MATTRKKTTSNARSGTKTGGSRSGTASRSRASAKNAKRPIRREVGGMVMLLLALIVLVSYFNAPILAVACVGVILAVIIIMNEGKAAPAGQAAQSVEEELFND